MSQFTDGYTPTEIGGSMSVLDETYSPRIEVSFQVEALPGEYPSEVADAVVAGLAAMKASLETSFPGVTVSGGYVGARGVKPIS
ncbi:MULTISPECIES: hypothetical protein [unclassified Streptomyces]|uniref:hypothetical protein n=1 Tax=unclassified Streptomyces TaxID=2593676 RepID=UPI0014880183|nr:MULTISPECIES: hypothetical protein [unclassified Streptomyces]